MKIYFALAMALTSIAFAVAGTSAGDMPITAFMEQNVDLPVNGLARMILLPDGGSPVDIRTFPHQCILRSKKIFICGCSILNKDFILTAAHCFASNHTSYGVIVGTTKLLSGGSTHMIKKINIHPKYAFPKDDIAVLELKMSINMSLPGRRAVILPRPFEQLRKNQAVFVTGWGLKNDAVPKWMSDTLQLAVLKSVRRKLCKKLWRKEGRTVTRKMICAKPEKSGTCIGDSGGPLVTKCGKAMVQFGIGSYLSKTQCYPLPELFTKVSAYIPWINQVALTLNF